MPVALRHRAPAPRGGLRPPRSSGGARSRLLEALRSPVPVAVLAGGLGAAQLAVWSAGLPRHAPATAFAWRAVLLGALQLASVALLWRRRERPLVWGVVAFAVAFRLAAWTWPPELSSDLHRYAWDGRVQLSGRSPYAGPPSDPSLRGLRDAEIWPRINRPDAPTVYPPGGQVVFLGLAAVGLDTVGGIKAAATLADLVTLVLIAVALSRRRLPAGRLVLYAWSPLVVSEVAVSGHLDAFVLPLALLALMLSRRRRDRPAPEDRAPGSAGPQPRPPAAAPGALIGAAAAMKLYPILLLLALPRRARLRAGAAAAAVLAAGYALYAPSAGVRVLGFLPDYFGSAEDFNIGLRALLQEALAPWLDHPRPVAMALTALLLAAACVHLSRRGGDPLDRAGLVALAFLLLLPTAAHPWYALWLVPFMVVRPRPAGLWLVLALPLSYLKYDAPGEVMPPWIPVVIWAPALLLVAARLALRARRRAPRGAAA